MNRVFIAVFIVCVSVPVELLESGKLMFSKHFHSIIHSINLNILLRKIKEDEGCNDTTNS